MLPTVAAFDVLGDPVRRAILELVADGELAAGAIGDVVQRRVRHLTAGRVPAPPGAPRERLPGRPARRRPAALLRRPARPAGRRRVAGPLPALLGSAARRPRDRGRARHARAPGRPPRHDQEEEQLVIDGNEQIASVHRQVSAPGAETRTVTLTQTYASDVDDLWDACHERGADPTVVPPGDGRPAPRRALPARRECRRHHRGVRAADAVPCHLGVRWGHELDRGAPRRGVGPTAPASSSRTPRRSTTTGRSSVPGLWASVGISA